MRKFLSPTYDNKKFVMIRDDVKAYTKRFAGPLVYYILPNIIRNGFGREKTNYLSGTMKLYYNTTNRCGHPRRR